MAEIRAAEPLDVSSLPRQPFSSLCHDYVNGLCRRGDQCPWSHVLCEIEYNPLESASLFSPYRRNNLLSSEPRRTLYDGADLESDGPGHFSAFGPRHDNDHVNIQDIQILPTADEILSLRRPYMPEKDRYSHVDNGVARLADTHFRHLRYDNTEPIIDVCYHACQWLTTPHEIVELSNYDDHVQTPRGIEYSLFRGIDIFEVSFQQFKGASVRVSFACPEELRGNKMHKSKCLEEGMLAALVGYDEMASVVSICFLEVIRRESTMAMRQRNGNELRG